MKIDWEFPFGFDSAEGEVRIRATLFSIAFLSRLLNRFSFPCEGNFMDVSNHYNFKLASAIGCDGKEK